VIVFEPAGVLNTGNLIEGYGVKAADDDTVAGVLLGMLEQALGSEFTPAVFIVAGYMLYRNAAVLGL
jgi:hypothetical protein